MNSPTRRVRIALALLPVVLLLVGAVACSGDEAATEETTAGTSTAESVIEAPTTGEDAATVTAEADNEPRPSGVVVLECGSSLWTVSSYQPAARASFEPIAAFPNPYSYRAALDCGDVPPPPPALRQLFSADYRLLALSQSRPDEESFHVGTMQAGGSFRDLTASPSGFVSPPRETNALFNPASGRLTYRSEQDDVTTVVSVDPLTGKGRRNETSEPGTKERFVFSPSGRYRVSSDALVFVHHNPDDTLWLQFKFGAGFYAEDLVVGKPGIKETYEIDLPEPCSATSWVDTRRFLCVSGGDEGGQAWLVTLAEWNSTPTARPLLPDTERTVEDAIPAPDGASFAFLSTLGDTVSLFVAPLSGNGKPVEIAQFYGGDDNNVRLIAWEPDLAP